VDAPPLTIEFPPDVSPVLPLELPNPEVNVDPVLLSEEWEDDPWADDPWL